MERASPIEPNRLLKRLLWSLVIALLLAPASVDSHGVDAAPTRLRWAYLVAYDANSLASLRSHVDQLDVVSPFWFGIDANGNFSRNDHDEDTANLIRSRGIKIVPVIKNDSSGATFHNIFNPGARANAINNIVGLLDRYNYDGIQIDFELMLASDRANFTSFVSELSSRVKAKGKLMTTTVNAKTRERYDGSVGAHDYAALAGVNDYIVVQAYGFKVSGSSIPGPTAPISWVDQVAAFATSQIPRGKLVLGVPWYGFDWNTVTGPPARSLRFSQAMEIVERIRAQLRYDESQQAPYFSYWSNGQRHEVWFESKRSQDAKLAIADKYSVAGVAGWRLGHEDPAAWESFGQGGSSPPPSRGPVVSTWYLAEGSTGWPFHTWILLMNPNDTAANTTVTFMKEGGGTIIRDYIIPPRARFNLFANEVVPNAAISTKVESDQHIYVERAMYFGHDGHDSLAATTGSQSWYLPEGFTGPGVDTWILVMNPNGSAANVTVTFMKDTGTTVVRRYFVPPSARLNVFANEIAPNAAFATKVEADRPVVAERSMYFDGGQGGHNSIGLPEPSTTWYFAEGNSARSTWFLLMNPNQQSANVKVSFVDELGRTTVRGYELKPTSRLTIYISDDIVNNAPFATKIEADQPIVAERAYYWNANTAGHSTIGATQLTRSWFLPEGSTASPFSEQILIANFNAVPANVTAVFMKEGGGTLTRTFRISPTSRFGFSVNDIVPNTAVSVQLSSDQPIVAERSMYFRNNAGGTNSVGLAR